MFSKSSQKKQSEPDNNLNKTKARSNKGLELIKEQKSASRFKRNEQNAENDELILNEWSIEESVTIG